MASTAFAPKNDTAAKIFEAADGLFAERGFAEVSVRDIAERAGVNKALIFYHFHTKEELFERILEGYYTAHAAALTAGGAATGPVRVRLHSLLDAYLDFMEENRRYAHLVLREIGRGSEAVAPIRRGLRLLYGQVQSLIGEVAPEGDALHPRQFFVSIAGLVNTYYLYAPVLSEMWDEDPLSVKNRRARREHLHWVTDALLDGLGVPR